ncbi:uncharacterized protein PV09_09392 [Verruconis gallopava]|uniref:Uncharacterized protein n=1 Tax=Verruconis gallopava TaxID=253628 RepID=A0A0D1YDQ2_9PEZI|nr:uncharacterized protein PV09_09392 [Verruconis gallopava]KIV98866.1 hypothetical protein PV09_09392 [Verruconis gallopava]
MNMWKNNRLYTFLLFACLRSVFSNNLELRDNSACEGNPQYSQCGKSYPSSWCCKNSTTCLPVNSTTTTVVLCCPDNSDCASIRPIPCNISNSSLSPVHILGEPPQLLTCGDSCCPPGYNCTSDICTIEPSLGLIPTSLPHPTVRKTFGGGIGVGIGITLATVAIACLVWALVQKRDKELPNLKSMISWPKQIPEGGKGEDEKTSLVEKPKPFKRRAKDTAGQPYEDLVPRSSEIFPPPFIRENSRKHSTPPPETVAEHGLRNKELLPYPEKLTGQFQGDSKVHRPPDSDHPAYQGTNKTASSGYGGAKYGSEYGQRRES